VKERALQSLLVGIAGAVGGGLPTFLRDEPLAGWFWPDGVTLAVGGTLAWFVYKSVRARAKP
jgi:hypothetical protein